MKEIWAEIADSNGWMISSEGNIRNPKGESIEPKNSMGYRRLSYNGKREWVHIIVAKAFISNPNNLPEVDHKNGIRNDNKVSNLRWCTRRENSLFAAIAGKFNNGGRRRPVVAVNSNTGEESYYDTQADAARDLGIRSYEINKALKGERGTAHGYKFFYLDEYFSKADKDSYHEWAFGKDGRQLTLFDYQETLKESTKWLKQNQLKAGYMHQRIN